MPIKATEAAAVAVPRPDGPATAEQFVVRGGLCSADRFRHGSGVSVDRTGRLHGISVQSSPGATIERLSQRRWVPQNQMGVTTVRAVIAAGGSVSPRPSPGNPYHATLSGLSATMAEQLFTPPVRNPNPRMGEEQE